MSFTYTAVLSLDCHLLKIEKHQDNIKLDPKGINELDAQNRDNHPNAVLSRLLSMSNSQTGQVTLLSLKINFSLA